MKEIAILIPTRKRYDSLVRCVRAFLDTCDNAASFEILLAFDNDDIETYSMFDKYVKDSNLPNVRLFKTERLGWARQFDYFEMLCKNVHQDTKWLVGWGDDVYMTGKGWDTVLTEKFNNQFVLPWVSYDNDEWANNQFPYNPILPISWYKMFGFPKHRQYDWYVKEIVKGLDLYRKHSDLWAHKLEMPDPETGKRQKYVNKMTIEEHSVKDDTRKRLMEYLDVSIPARTRKAVATFADRKFLPGLEVMVYSLLKHTAVDTKAWELVVLSNELTAEDLKNVSRMWSNLTVKSFDVSKYGAIDKKLRDSMPGANGSYCKFELFGLNDYDRIIALDSDLLFLQDVSELFECNAPIAAVKELLIDQYNSGVMVIGSEFLNWDIVRRLIRATEIMGPKEHADQDTISAFFAGDLTELSINLNFLKIYYNYPFLNKYPFPSHIKVLHYIIHKPWIPTNFINEIEIGTEGLNVMWHNAYAEMNAAIKG